MKTGAGLSFPWTITFTLITLTSRSFSSDSTPIAQLQYDLVQVQIGVVPHPRWTHTPCLLGTAHVSALVSRYLRVKATPIIYTARGRGLGRKLMLFRCGIAILDG